MTFEQQMMEMETRAQRQLDGMTVNRDLMANDVLALVKLARRSKQVIEKYEVAAKLRESVAAMDRSRKSFEKSREDDFSELYSELFGGRGFGRRK